MPGFLGTRGTLMLDLVVVAMAMALPVLLWSVYLVRSKRRYRQHKFLQLGLSAILLITIVAFELEMRLAGWQQHATASPWYREGRWNDPVDYLLAVHLVCAVPTFVVWSAVVYRALRFFPRQPGPSAHSGSHRFWGRLAVTGLSFTAITGWLFYYAAFVRT